MNREQHLLIKLAEECTEVSHRVSKALRFGLSEVQPGQGQDNCERLWAEVHDLIAIVELLGDEGILPKQLNIPRVDRHKAQVAEFLEYSEKCGTLEEEQNEEITDDDVITVARWLPHIASRDIRAVIRFGLARMGKSAAISPELATQIAEAWLS